MAAYEADADASRSNVVRLSPAPRRSTTITPETIPAASKVVSFDRMELRMILDLYGRQVAAGEWRDYAIDFSGERAEFCIMRRSNEYPTYRIRKVPALAKKQGAFAVVSVTGFIVKRGHDLRKVLAVLEPKALRPA